MLGLLEKGGDRLREAILRATVGVVLEDAGPILKRFAREQFNSYGYVQIRHALKVFLSSQTDPRSVPALRELCTKSGGPLREYSLTALARFSDPADLPLLIETISNTKNDVRTSTIEALTYFDDPRARDTLRRLALSASRDRLDAAIAFCQVASDSDKARFLDESVEQEKFDVAGVVDYYLNAPPWWRSD